ncbi:MAG: hypothetical protein ACUVUG_01150 [Candidatus Aminicenantia bacterium]
MRDMARRLRRKLFEEDGGSIRGNIIRKIINYPIKAETSGHIVCATTQKQVDEIKNRCQYEVYIEHALQKPYRQEHEGFLQTFEESISLFFLS